MKGKTLIAIWLITFILYFPVLSFLNANINDQYLHVFTFTFGFLNAILLMYSFYKWFVLWKNKKANPRYIIWLLALMLNLLITFDFILNFIYLVLY